MPFEVLKTISGVAKKSSASISYRAPKSKNGGNPPRLVVGIPAVFCDLLGPHHLGPGQRYAFHLGTGEDGGKARIVRAGAEGSPPRMVKGGATFNFGVVPMLADAGEAPKEFVPVQVIDDGFEIGVPDWLAQYS
jgi:hypothetical protein